MDFSYLLSRSRWRRRFQSEREVAAAALAVGRTPDASVDEVGVPADNLGFDGRRRLASPVGNGQGTGDPTSPGWAGWAG